MELKEQTINIGVGTIVKAIVIVLLFGLLFLLKNLILVFLVSIVVASAVEPATQWFVRRGVPRLFSVILIYLSIAACLVGIVFFLLLPLLAESSDFLKNVPLYFNASVVSNTLNNNQFLSSQPFFSGLTNSLNLEE